MSSFHKDTEELCTFISASPTQFHAVRNMKEQLAMKGFISLDEKERWNLRKGSSYFVTRNGSALIAFSIPGNDYRGYSLVSAHTDSPAFKVKTDAEVTASKLYTTLNTEVYGGLLMAPWFDRPLSIAGRVFVRNGRSIEERLVDFSRAVAMIPNLAIHMNRKVLLKHTYIQ